MQALVRPVRPGVGVLDTGHQHGGGREQLLEGRDERDRSAHPDVYRLDAIPCGAEGRTRRVIGRAVGVDDARSAVLIQRDRDMCAPRSARLEVRLDGRERLNGIIAGRKAFRAGRIPRRLYASASSPLDGLIE